EFGIDHVTAVRRPDAPDLVRGDAHAVTSAADQDTAIDRAGADRLGHRNRVVGIIDARGAAGPQVAHFVTEFVQQSNHSLLDGHPTVVVTPGNLHWPIHSGMNLSRCVRIVWAHSR